MSRKRVRHRCLNVARSHRRDLRMWWLTVDRRRKSGLQRDRFVRSRLGIGSRVATWHESVIFPMYGQRPPDATGGSGVR